MPKPNVAIMKLINASMELTQKWHEMKMTLEADVRQEFLEALGVPIPTAYEAEVLSLNSSPQFASQGTADAFTKGVTGIIGSAFEGDWPVVALSATNLVSALVESAYVNGEVQMNVQGDSQKVEEKGETFVVATYLSMMEGSASQWGTSENFVSISYVLAIWKPSAGEKQLLKI